MKTEIKDGLIYGLICGLIGGSKEFKPKKKQEKEE